MEIISESIEGTVRFMRDESRRGEPCICCPGGRHVFARTVDWEQWDTGLPEYMGRGANIAVDAFIRRPGMAGRRVRLTIELLEDAE